MLSVAEASLPRKYLLMLRTKLLGCLETVFSEVVKASFQHPEQLAA